MATRKRRRARATIVLIGAALLARAGAADEWGAPEVERDGVRVYSRPAAGSAVREMKVVGVIRVPAARLFAALADIERYPGAMPPTVGTRLLRREGRTAWYHIEIAPPWIARRDYCLRTTFSSLPGGIYRSEWTVANELCPPAQPRRVRITVSAGSWELTPLPGGDATAVVHLAHTDPGGDVPAWMVNRFTARELPDVFAALGRAALHPRYAPCAADVTRCLPWWR